MMEGVTLWYDNHEKHERLVMLWKYYRIGLTWTSNALEGNSLTESETKVILEDGLTVGGGNRCVIYWKQLIMQDHMILCFLCFRA